MSETFKRIMTDFAGYILIVIGVALGWLPGPGGIPLVLAGLGLLSINNAWARRWRDWLVKNSGQLMRRLFPKNRLVEDLYDLAAVLIIGLVAFLIWRHAAIWQISLAAGLFFVVITIIGTNRDRASRLKQKITKNK